MEQGRTAPCSKAMAAMEVNRAMAATTSSTTTMLAAADMGGTIRGTAIPYQQAQGTGYGQAMKGYGGGGNYGAGGFSLRDS